MNTKNAVQSVTLWGLVIALVPIVSAIMATGWTTENIALLVGWITALVGRLRQGNLTFLPKSVPPAALLLVVLVLGACGTCPPGTAENANNVEAIVAENDTAIPAEPASVAAAKRLRNAEAKALADKIKEACK